LLILTPYLLNSNCTTNANINMRIVNSYDNLQVVSVLEYVELVVNITTIVNSIAISYSYAVYNYCTSVRFITLHAEMVRIIMVSAVNPDSYNETLYNGWHDYCSYLVSLYIL
jgi:hypothetical protein